MKDPERHAADAQARASRCQRCGYKLDEIAELGKPVVCPECGPIKAECPRCHYDLSGLEPVGNTYICPECAMASRALTWSDNYAGLLDNLAKRKADARKKQP